MKLSTRLTVMLSAAVLLSAVAAVAWTATASATSIGPFQVVNYSSGLCMDVAGSGTDDGTTILQWSCHRGANQLWHFHYTYTNNDYFLMSPHHDLQGCVSQSDDPTTDAQLYSCIIAPGGENDNPFEGLLIGTVPRTPPPLPVPGLQYRYQFSGFLGCLGVDSDSQGAHVKFQHCDGSARQLWVVTT